MSFQIELEPKEQASTDLISEVGFQLQQSLAEARRDKGLTQQAIAMALGVNRSSVHKCLSGYHNLTLKTLAELAWALDKVAHVKLCDPHQGIALTEIDGSNYYTDPVFEAPSKPKNIIIHRYGADNRSDRPLTRRGRKSSSVRVSSDGAYRYCGTRV